VDDARNKHTASFLFAAIYGAFVIFLTFDDIYIQFRVQKKQETYQDEVIH
jgi:hypothetical protein